MAINIKPLSGRILVEVVEPKEVREVRKGGIIIPDSAKELPVEGIVIALGSEKTDEHGKKIPFEVKKGDRVLISEYGGKKLPGYEKQYRILDADELFGIIE